MRRRIVGTNFSQLHAFTGNQSIIEDPDPESEDDGE